MYRSIEASVIVAEDSNVEEGDITARRKIVAYQTKDLFACNKKLRVAPADAEAQVTLSPVTTGYFWAIFSDYPVKYRINGSTATQHTMRSNNTSNVNVGAPLPPQCIACGTSEVTSIYIAPIASAAQTANVNVIVTGDPASSYV